MGGSRTRVFWSYQPDAVVGLDPFVVQSATTLSLQQAIPATNGVVSIETVWNTPSTRATRSR